jgi:hypothetical protein
MTAVYISIRGVSKYKKFNNVILILKANNYCPAIMKVSYNLAAEDGTVVAITNGEKKMME